MKRVSSKGYNYVFSEDSGFFARWGETLQDDPEFSPLGPEIADIEVTTECHGPNGKVCKFCYKGNTPVGKHMSLETFKTIFHKLPANLTQIAFGVDAACTANPDVWEMFDYCRTNDYNKVVPNVTVANVGIATAYKLANSCGGVAVSRYENKDWCYDSVQRLVTFGLQQVNIHQLLSEETFDKALETIDDYHEDERLIGLKAIVFLSLKQKERGKSYKRLSRDRFSYLVNYALQKDVPIGFDSCSAGKFFDAVKSHEKMAQFEKAVEPCESSCFSMYVNVDGEYFPCSFSEGGKFDKAGDWSGGISMLSAENFMQDIWGNRRTTHFRDALLGNKDKNGIRSCPLYDL